MLYLLFPHSILVLINIPRHIIFWPCIITRYNPLLMHIYLLWRLFLILYLSLTEWYQCLIHYFQMWLQLLMVPLLLSFILSPMSFSNFFRDQLLFYLDYTVHMVTGKHHKSDEKTPNLRCTYLHQFLEFFKTKIPVQLVFNAFIILWVTYTASSEYFSGFRSKPKIYLSLDRALNFQIHLGIHPKKTGEKLVYYYLYYEEASFFLGFCTHLFWW